MRSMVPKSWRRVTAMTIPVTISTTTNTSASSARDSELPTLAIGP